MCILLIIIIITSHYQRIGCVEENIEKELINIYMEKKRVYLYQIEDLLQTKLLKTEGNDNMVFVDSISDSKNVTETSLDWVNYNKVNKQEIAENSIARVLVVDETVQYSDTLKKKGKVLLVVKNPRLIMAEIADHFFLEKCKPGVHSSVIIDESAIIDESSHIGAGCVIGKVKIGANTVIMPNVVIYDNVSIGDNCVIQAGVVIGTDGLGCMRDNDGKLTKFPHLGGVVIGDNVEIGANSQIAKGSLSNTIIENGCKMNGLCFIAHNCYLEENVWITGNTMLCGSVHVKRNSTIFSSVIVRDQRTIGESAVIGMGSVVTKDVPDGETWIGNPAKKIEKK